MGLLQAALAAAGSASSRRRPPSRPSTPTPPTAGATDWVQIVEWYDELAPPGRHPVVTLNRAVAVGEADGARAGLELLDGLAADRLLARSHRLLATRAHLLELLGDREGGGFRLPGEACRHTTSAPERRHLTERARRLG
ncbi:hypothetical protein STANM309S_01162 [Streptomyces tanashiensis]